MSLFLASQINCQMQKQLLKHEKNSFGNKKITDKVSIEQQNNLNSMMFRQKILTSQ